MIMGLFSTQGGNRTRTPKNWILNPARLPIPPLELVSDSKNIIFSLILTKIRDKYFLG